MSSFNAIASDDAYMKKLRDEAEDLKLNKSGQISNTDELDAKD